MSESAHIPKSLPYHVLDFFYDDEDSCALTILLRNVRFHIIADIDKFDEQKARKEYLHLLRDVKSLDGDQNQDNGTTGSDTHDAGSGTDSGVDVTRPKSSGVSGNAKHLLYKWMVSPLGTRLQELAPERQSHDEPTLAEWYDCPTHFFDLEANHKAVRAVELEATADLEARMRKLRPQLKIPNYIRDIDVPWYSTSDLTVLTCSDELAAYHPCRVRLRGSKDDATYFLKLVDEPVPSKREIRLLDKISRLDLQSKMRCPKLEALVTFSPSTEEESRDVILGFLQTDIKKPTPLTGKLDVSVSQEKRERWAQEVERMKTLLHENGIVWGDAKADNFMVDEDEELWIIDFGGSYTEGWVDEDLNETEEGDDMGVSKVVNALEDPVGNTFDPDDSGDDDAHGRDEPVKGRKREASEALDGESTPDHRPSKTPRLAGGTQANGDRDEETTAGADDDDDDDNNNNNNNEADGEQSHAQETEDGTTITRSETTNDENLTKTRIPSDESEQTYCYCSKPSSGEMIGCDNDDCSRQWFHFACVGMTSAPPESEKWYCKDCSRS